MLIRFSLGIMLILGLTGCATTQSKGQYEQLQGRVTELEKKIEEKDAEIVDLQYEIKDISGKIDSGGNTAAPAADAYQQADVPLNQPSGGRDIIRVNVPPEAVQAALKNAGLYAGKIDGKVGAGTKTAIIEFQKTHGLKADGILGRRTWEELKVYSK